ncbi:MAG: energy transducer TonB [Saprospiraceae bacterium]|nr:energy transducer TonB [Saprospiraceae bacterium]
MKKERKEKHFIKKPDYPGGSKAIQAFIYKHLKYPKEALEKGIEGSVYLRYSIDQKGKVVDTRVISSLGYGCDEEAARVVKKLKFQVDKAFRRRVTWHKKIRVWFKKKKPTKTNIQYQLKSDPKKEKPTSSGYSYTITIKGS